MLSKATSDDQSSTPGYTLDEISGVHVAILSHPEALTFESVNMCNELLEYLLSRLKKKSPYTKAKVLIVRPSSPRRR